MGRQHDRSTPYLRDETLQLGPLHFPRRLGLGELLGELLRALPLLPQFAAQVLQRHPQVRQGAADGAGLQGEPETDRLARLVLGE